MCCEMCTVLFTDQLADMPVRPANMGGLRLPQPAGDGAREGGGVVSESVGGGVEGVDVGSWVGASVQRWVQHVSEVGGSNALPTDSVLCLHTCATHASVHELRDRTRTAGIGLDWQKLEQVAAHSRSFLCAFRCRMWLSMLTSCWACIQTPCTNLFSDINDRMLSAGALRCVPARHVFMLAGVGVDLVSQHRCWV